MAKIASRLSKPSFGTAFFVCAQFILITVISSLSTYMLKREGYVVNFDIITMLTPSGLIQNFVVDPSGPLYPFYFRINARPGLFESPWLAIVILLNVALAGFWLWRQKKL